MRSPNNELDTLTFSRYSHSTNIYSNLFLEKRFFSGRIKENLLSRYNSSTVTEIIGYENIKNPHKEVKRDSLGKFENSLCRRDSPYSSPRYRKSVVVRFCIFVLICKHR